MKQESADTLNELERMGSQVSREDDQSLTSQSEEEEINRNHENNGPGLESDLETILETDQESNYMTTARTLANN